MKSTTTDPFHTLLAGLLENIRQQAKRNYELFKQNPYHPSLQFKQVNPSAPIYSVRIGRGYRALGRKDGNEITWFWIGSHGDYDKLI